MEMIDGSIINQTDGFTTQNMMFTYSEEEQLENKIAKNNSQLVLNPKFIPLYPRLLREMDMISAVLYGFIEFFLSNNDRFYCSNEQLSKLLNVSEKTIQRSIQDLQDKNLIKCKYKIKPGGGKIRFVELSTGQNVLSEGTNCPYIYNNIIYNKNNNISKDILLLNDKNNEEVDINEEGEMLDKIENTEIKEVKQYGKPEINDLIGAIKEECNRLGVAYVKKKERNFSQLILTSKDYGELCDKLGMSRKEFAVNILRASVAIGYFKGACSGPMRIYENYAEVYNLTKQKSDKNKQVEQNFTSLY